MDCATQPASSRRTRWLRSILRIGVLLAALVLIFWLTGCMERLFYYPTSGPTPLPAEFPRAEAVDFTSGDGTALYGWFIPALDAAPRAKRPTVLHFHGNAGNIESHLFFTEYLPAAGYHLFIFDYRGYGQSAGTARKRNDLIADGHAALDALLARDDVDPAHIFMYGQSLGGSIGLKVMAERTEIRAAVLESAFTSWRAIAADALGGGAIARFFAAILIPDHARPIDSITRIDRPILILHGDHDSIIPIDHGRQLAAAAPNATLIELPGGEHNSLRMTNPESEKRVVEFLRGVQ